MASQVERRLGERVAAYRETAGLTQERLAAKVDVAVETISRLERGSSTPSVARLDEIAGALGVELRDLFDFRDAGANARDQAVDALVRDLKAYGQQSIELLRDIVAKTVKLARGVDKKR